MNAALNFFIQGLWHPFLMPAHLMLLLAMALLSAQQGLAVVWRAWWPLVAGLIVGIGFTLLSPMRWDLEVIQLSLAMLLGLWVVWYRPALIGLVAALALLVGLLVGLDSAAPRIPGLRGFKVYALQMGTVLSCALLSLGSGVLAAVCKDLLEGIPLRVLGAWISAGSVLVLTLYLTKTITL